MAKIDVETQEIEYLHNTTLQDTAGNYIYLHDNQITRGKLTKYNLSTHCTESLQKLDSRLVKIDQANGVAYIVDSEGLKRFVLD